MLSRLLIKECSFLFSDNAQQAQYEEWLQETQQLLQMQQKFLEEKIGAHRKSKKALSAKQRTAKKAGREFPEEDAEQLKHVTEQQGVVQKQLEQVTIPHLLLALRMVSLLFWLCLFSTQILEKDKQQVTTKIITFYQKGITCIVILR